MNAQKKFTLDDLTPGGLGYKKYISENLEQLQWWSDTLVFVKDSTIVRMRPATQKQTILCSLSEMNTAFEKEKIKPLKKFPPFLFPSKKPIICFETPTAMVFFDTNTHQILDKIKWKKDWKHRDFCSQNGYFAFASGNDLCLVTSDKKIKINRGGSKKDIVYGQAVHRDEFGITKGTFWSPKGKHLAFYRMDESMVADYTLIDNSKSPSKKNKIKYPSAGEANHQVAIGIYSLQKDEVSYLKTGAPADRFFTNVCWSPNGKELLIAELNRKQDTCVLKSYDIRTGEGREIFTETAKTYVEPEHTPVFINDTQFIWQSERTGHNHLYLYNLLDNTCQTLTKGEWDVLDICNYNKKRKELVFYATKDSPLESNIYSLEIESAELRKLSTQGGQHKALLSASGQFIVDEFSSINIPRKINIIDIQSTEEVTILTASNPYQEKHELPEMQLGMIKAADKKTDLHYRLTLPIGFDAKKKYPVVVYVYGGPHVQLLQNAWLGGSKGWELYMAQEGFICFSLDGRGSANRGQAFEEAVYKNIGKAPLDDQLEGVAFLKSLPYIDSTRMGIYGWSFGGFMTTQLMTKTAGVFKVGVAGGSVIDWRLYEVMYGERYMQTPQTNPQGYAENDLTPLAKNLKGKFMMLHCELDPVVRINNTELFLEAAKKAGKKVEFIRYQKHEHNVRGKDRVGMFEKITKFFVENL